MVLKKGVGLFGLVLLLAVFINLSSVNAGIQCADDQIILRLSSTTNAHGEIWNGAGNYTTEICYDDIFGTVGNGVRTCTGTNEVVGLSASTNAHAEDPSLSNYGTPVCYGDLSCTARSGSCTAGENLTLSLSASTNAHLATSGYPINICCTAPLPVGQCTINSAVWEVLQTVEGQSVDLEVTTTNCQGLTMSFLIEEEDGFGMPNDAVNINPQNVVVSGNGTAVVSWIAEYQDDNDIFENNPPEYKFTASIASAGVSQSSSNLLEVSQTSPPFCQGVVTCGNYGNQQDCENDICMVANNSVGSTDCNDPDIDCECAWNIGSGICQGSWTNTSSGGSGVGTCFYSDSTTDTCDDDGFLTVDFTATWIYTNGTIGSDPSCQSSTEVIACPAQIPLPFFTFLNLVIALVLIAVIYLAINRRKGQGKNRKRR